MRDKETINNEPQTKDGFTLVELLVVIAIIALLIGILMPALNIAQKKAMYAVCRSQFHQLGIATLTYADENRYRLPSGNFFNYPVANHGEINGNNIAYDSKAGEGFIAVEVQPYLGSRRTLSTDFSIFLCPADKATRESPAFFEGETAQYGNLHTQGETTEEWYKSGHLNFSGPFDNYSYYIYYYYFGNYAWELTRQDTMWEPYQLLLPEERALKDKGFIYPAISTGPRAKLMQDIVTQRQMDYFGLIPSHEKYNPNGLFTDGSVEVLPKSKLELHRRFAGIIIDHLW